jgi:hypothetical protein
MTSRIKPAGNEDAPRKTQGGISSTPVLRISQFSPQPKAIPVSRIQGSKGESRKSLPFSFPS